MLHKIIIHLKIVLKIWKSTKEYQNGNKTKIFHTYYIVIAFNNETFFEMLIIDQMSQKPVL